MEKGCKKYNVLASILDGSMEPRDLRFSLLETITDDFSEERRIGEGGFAEVYKGVLQCGEVAVKRIMNNMTIDETLFRREVNSLTQVINHPNIVRFLGFCSNTTHRRVEYEGQIVYVENRERLLCFEYINNGSLDKYITDELRGLEWNTRYNIIRGICNGLEYLHKDRGIFHMDLKPANILLDKDMKAKITDFGLSRMDGKSQTTSANRFISQGYCAPEYLDDGKISAKCDVYSLGAIIIELVTGHKRTPDINKVLRRWRHRWNKSGQGTPFRYKQVGKLIEIGLLCKEFDPYKRPFISNILRDINELERTDRQISDTDESTIGKISPYPEDDMLGIEPLKLCFPFELNKQMSCSLQLTNETHAYIAFSVGTTSSLHCIEPTKGIVAPQSNCSVKITLQPLDKLPQDMQNTSDFVVRSTKLNGTPTSENITEDTFKEDQGKVIDEVNLTVSHEPLHPEVNLPLESLIISGTGNLNSLEASYVSAEAESKASLLVDTSDQLIQFDPPELRFPFFPNNRVPMMGSIKIINATDHRVGFKTRFMQCNSAIYEVYPCHGFLPPQSTQRFMVLTESKKKGSEDMRCRDDVISVANSIVTGDIEACDFTSFMEDKENKQLPIIFTNTTPPCTSDELIRFDPPELRFLFVPNKTMVSCVNMVNSTDYFVGYVIIFKEVNTARYKTKLQRGIMPPRSAQRLVVKRVQKKNEQGEDMRGGDEFLLWNMIVNEGIEASDLTGMEPEEGATHMKVPIVLENTSLLCAVDELVQFDPPELYFPFLPNKRVRMVSFFKIVNLTDHCVGFNAWVKKRNSALYYTTPSQGILQPRSTQTLKVQRVPKENKSEDMQGKDDVFCVWNGIVGKGVEAEDLIYYKDDKDSKQFPIVFGKTTPPCTSEDLIRFDPPELSYSITTNKTMVSCVNMVNNTNYSVGFVILLGELNVAWYIPKLPSGIMPPRSAQRLVVKRVVKKKEQGEDIHGGDRFILWNKIVTEDIKANDLTDDIVDDEDNTELPIVLRKTSLLCTSDELVQFDPPEARFPFLPNKRFPISCTVKIINITDQFVGFNMWVNNSNSALYSVNPCQGILTPRSAQVLNVKKVPKENESEYMQCTNDVLSVWNGIVTEGVQAEDLVDYVDAEESKQLPIVLTKPSLLCTSDELIQFDPPELQFPFFPNKTFPVSCTVKVINVTDHCVGFKFGTNYCNSAWYHIIPWQGILSPRSTQALQVTRVPKEKELEDIYTNDVVNVWNCIVTEGVQAEDLVACDDVNENKKLPIVLTETSLLCTSDELIRFDPPELHFPFLPNKRFPISCTVKVINVTDHCICFKFGSKYSNSAWYHVIPWQGILSPRSTQAFKVTRVPKEKEPEDMQYTEDVFGVWNCIVSEGVQAGDLVACGDGNENKQLPIVLTKTSLCNSDELIQFDPPELRFPFNPNKTLPTWCSVNIVNVTDLSVGFRLAINNLSSARYNSSLTRGILPPRSAKEFKLRRIRNEKESQDMQCEDVVRVWNGIVMEGVQDEDLNHCLYGIENKRVPIVLTKPEESSST